MRAEELIIRAYPPPPERGLDPGAVGAGVEIEHILTGCLVRCTTERSQAANKQRALHALRVLVSDHETSKD